jgi:tetratricopeptide (TPR) repeat protein
VIDQPYDDSAGQVHDDAIEQFVAEGNLKPALDYLDAVQARNTKSHTLLWLAAARAKIWALIGESKKAETYLAEAQELISAGASTSPRLTITLLNTKGLILLTRQSLPEADNAFEEAEQCAVRYGSDWQRAATLINRACIAIASQDPNRALTLLDAAHSACVKSNVRKSWKTSS